MNKQGKAVNSAPLVKAVFWIILALVLIVLGGFKFFDRVDNGNVGIRYAISGGVRDKALSQGIHFVGLDYVTQYPIKTQSIRQSVAVATGDGKKTDVEVAYSYHVDPSQAVAIYKKFGSADIHAIETGWLAQMLQKASREAMAKFTLLEVVGTDSTKAQAEILKNFQKSTEPYGFVVEEELFTLLRATHPAAASVATTHPAAFAHACPRRRGPHPDSAVPACATLPLERSAAARFRVLFPDSSGASRYSAIAGRWRFPVG